MREDHDRLRAALRQLQDSPQAVSVEFLHELGARLRAHVQMEERELFPNLERSLDPPAALDQIGARLASEPGGEPAGVVRRFLTAFIERDIGALLALADPAIELHPLRLTDTPAYTGHEGVRRWLEDLERRAVNLSFEVQEVRAVDAEQALARVRVRAGGDEFAAVTAVFTVTAGKVTQVHGYFSDQELLSQLGIL